MRIIQIYEWIRIKKNTGFTLVETLVAISILSLSITATFTAVQNGIQNSTIAKDQTTAFYLTQEAMEFIKNIRDENALYSVKNPDAPRSWLYGLSETTSDPCWWGGSGVASKICIIDSPLKSASSASCGTSFGTCSNINQDPATGLYGYTSGWTPTNFKREIQFQQISADEVAVIISMSWTSRGAVQTFQVTESLFNRQ